MTGDKQKLKNLSEYEGSRTVVTTNNSWLLIAHKLRLDIVPIKYRSEMFIMFQV